MNEKTVEITEEDNIMLLKLIASLSENTYPEELDWSMLMSSFDIIHTLGADICIIWGRSILITMGDYFNRVNCKEDLGLHMFQALHHFSHWYLKHRTNGQQQ
jgi:hypothetical protein